MSILAKVYNLFRSPAPLAKQDKSNDILPYGRYNDFPLRITEAIYDSPVATSALNKLQKYIGGDGIGDQDIAKMVVNGRGETLDQLLKQIVEDFTLLRGFSLDIRYNQMFKVVSVTHVPYENSRLSIPDSDGEVNKIAINPFFGMADYKKKNTCFRWTFDPKKVAEQYAEEKDNYKGQVYWFGQSKISNRFYPIPDYYSAMNDIVADAKTGTYRERLVDNNFYQSTLIQMIGDPDEKVKTGDGEDDYETVGELLDKDLRKMTGGEMAGSAMVFWSKTAESAAKITPFPNNYNDKISEAFIKQVQQNICMAVGVHPVIIGIDQGATLGNNGLLLNAIKMLQQNVNDPQREIERCLQEIFTHWHTPFDVSKITIRPLSLTVDLPEYVLNTLTAQEKRAWVAKNYDVEMTEPPAQDEVQKRLNTLSMLSPLLANKVIEKLTDEEVRSLINLHPIVEEIPVETQIATQLNLFEGYENITPLNMSKGAIEARYNEYYSLVNMTYKELQTWSESECCKKLGYSKQPIQRNLHILNLNKSDWSAKEFRMAGIITSAIKKLQTIEVSNEVMNNGTSCGLKKDLALKNYGHNIDKL
jgi:YHS domain-containing protein